MEDILDSKDDENLINLFRLKNRVYNETFKIYIFIFNQIKNINFSSLSSFSVSVQMFVC